MIWGLDNRGCADLFKGVILFAVATLGLYKKKSDFLYVFINVQYQLPVWNPL